MSGWCCGAHCVFTYECDYDVMRFELMVGGGLGAFAGLVAVAVGWPVFGGLLTAGGLYLILY